MSGNSQGGPAEDGVARGTWGGDHVRLQVGEDGAEIEFDCAHGRMGRLTADARGDFSVEGVFVPERGGPVREEDREVSHPARYEGRVEGKRMTLTVRVRADGREQEPAAYTLTHGRGARLTKCL